MEMSLCASALSIYWYVPVTHSWHLEHVKAMVQRTHILKSANYVHTSYQCTSLKSSFKPYVQVANQKLRQIQKHELRACRMQITLFCPEWSSGWMLTSTRVLYLNDVRDYISLIKNTVNFILYVMKSYLFE